MFSRARSPSNSGRISAAVKDPLPPRRRVFIASRSSSVLSWFVGTKKAGCIVTSWGKRIRLWASCVVCLSIAGRVAPLQAATITCMGDCDGNGNVTVAELVIAVNIALNIAPLSACPAFDPCGPLGGICINSLVGAVKNALDGCPTPVATATATATPTPTATVPPSPQVYVYWDQNEEEDALTPDGQLTQLVTPWDPNGQMAIFPDESGRFVIPYDPTLPSQHNPGSFRPVKYPPIGLAVYDRLGNFTGQTIFVPGPYAGGDIPPTKSGIYNDNGTFEGAVFDAKGDLFATDIGQGQGSASVPDQGRIVEWFPPDYTAYCIIIGPTQGGMGPHHVDGSGGLKDPQLMAFDPQGNLYVPETGAVRVLRFDHSVLPTSADQCGPDQLLSPPAPYTVFITGGGATAGIARDPTCSTDTSNCWAVTNVISGAFGGNAVSWFDTDGNPTTVRGPIPKSGTLSPFGIGVTPNGDVYFIDIALICDSSGCNTVDFGGGIYKVTFANGQPSAPVQLAGGMDFPTSITICDASQHVCPMPQQPLLSTPTPCSACTPTPTPPCGVTDSPCTSSEQCCSGQCIFQGACQ